MTEDGLTHIAERIELVRKDVAAKAGPGFEHKYTFDDGETQRLVVEGIRSPSEFGQRVGQLAEAAWALKDYIKLAAEDAGIKPKDYEVAVNDAIQTCPSLGLCSDIANSLKHGKIDRTRSGRRARLGAPKVVMPGESFASIAFIGNGVVKPTIAHPDRVTYSVPVVSDAGDVLGDAVTVIEEALAELERIRERLLPRS
jgi:hypothetical protein